MGKKRRTKQVRRNSLTPTTLMFCSIFPSLLTRRGEPCALMLHGTRQVAVPTPRRSPRLPLVWVWQRALPAPRAPPLSRTERTHCSPVGAPTVLTVPPTRCMRG